MKKVLVTGAAGFVGRTLVPALRERGWSVRAAVRAGAVPSADETIVIGDVRSADWSTAVTGVDAIVHLVAQVHTNESNSGAFDEINETATLQLGVAARVAGVRRFVFLSTIKVNGESTSLAPFTESSVPAPVGPYAKSKFRAEARLRDCAFDGMHVTCIRPPLVFGPGVRANFLRLLRWVDRGVPLPFADVENRRSLISAWNLCHLIATVLDASIPPPLLVAAENPAISTPDLLRLIAREMGRSARLIAVPRAILYAGATLTLRGKEFLRLCGSLEVDATVARKSLGWEPILSLQEGLRRTVAWYMDSRR